MTSHVIRPWRPYRFRSRGTIGSSILDHDFGHLCRGRRIQKSGHSDFGIFNNLWASSIFTWEKAILRLLLFLRCLAVWTWYPWFLRPPFKMLTILVQWILQKIQNHLSQYHLGVQLNLCVLSAWKMTHVHQWGKMNCSARRPCFIDYLLSTSDKIFSNLSHFLSTAAFAAGMFMAWSKGWNLSTKLWCSSELSPFPARWSSWWFDKDSSIRSPVDSLDSKMHESFDLVLMIYHGSLHAYMSCKTAGAIGVSNFLRSFLMVSLNSLSSGSMK